MRQRRVSRTRAESREEIPALSSDSSSATGRVESQCDTRGSWRGKLS